MFSRSKSSMPTPDRALRGRANAIPTAARHYLFDRPLRGPYPAGIEQAMFGMGCFWGVEKKFWEQGAGIWITAAGYSAGFTPNPTYDEVCSGLTGHNEVVLVAFDPELLSYERLLAIFWESHDPTQGMRQGNDRGTQYRSGIYTFGAGQADAAQASAKAYQAALTNAGYGLITTEIQPAAPFYFAEEYHQQYLAKVPHGYCGMAGTGVACPAGTGVKGGAQAD